MPRTKIARATIGGLHDVYEAWKAKNPIDPETGQRPVFRIAIGLSPKTLPNGANSEEAKKKDKENWGALMDAIVQFARERLGQKLTDVEKAIRTSIRTTSNGRLPPL